MPSNLNLKLAGCWKLCRNLSTANELNGLEQGGASPIRRIFDNFSGELRRITLPRTSVNRGKEEGPGLIAVPALSVERLVLL